MPFVPGLCMNPAIFQITTLTPTLHFWEVYRIACQYQLISATLRPSAVMACTRQHDLQVYDTFRGILSLSPYREAASYASPLFRNLAMRQICTSTELGSTRKQPKKVSLDSFLKKDQQSNPSPGRMTVLTTPQSTDLLSSSGYARSYQPHLPKPINVCPRYPTLWTVPAGVFVMSSERRTQSRQNRRTSSLE
jgi:hypothetical protein